MEISKWCAKGEELTKMAEKDGVCGIEIASNTNNDAQRIILSARKVAGLRKF